MKVSLAVSFGKGAFRSSLIVDMYRIYYKAR